MTNLKVIISDDDPVILRDLRKSVPWEQMNFSLVGTAQNGEIAYQLIKKYHPDLVITDVVMPVVDGLELAQRINENYPQTHVLLLSSYDDFSYVKKALEFGAVDYMLKTAFDLNELIVKLQKIHNDIMTSMTHISEYRNLLLRKAFSSIGITSTFVQDSYSAPDWMISTLYNFTLVAFHIPFYTKYEEYSGSMKIKVASISNRLHTYMGANSSFSDFILFDTGNFIVFGAPINLVSSSSYRYLSSEIQQSLSGEDFFVFSVNSVSVEKLYRQFNDIYPQLKYECLYNAKTLFTVERFQRMTSLHLNTTNYVEISDQDIVNNNILDKIIDQFSTFHTNRDYVGIIDYYHKLCHQFEVLTDWQCSVPDNLFVKSFDELVQWLTDFYWKCITIRKEQLQNKNKFSPIVTLAIKYMESNMQNPDLVTADIAQAIAVSASTLRVHFREELGISVTEYLTELRIKTACQLLSGSSLRIYEISDRVGFRTSQYFSKVFSERMNYRPLEYRNAGV